MQVHDSLTETVGNTPLVRLREVTRELRLAGAGPDVLAKVEYFNPGGSVKDRIALRMIQAAEAAGQLRPGGTIVEPTSGNTGVGLAIVAAERGYKCVFVCPDKVAADKLSVLRAYGADVVVCPSSVPPAHPDSYYSVARRMAAELPGGWQPDQYANPENPGLALRVDRPGDLVPDRRPCHPLRGRDRHRRDHQRRGPVPQGRVRRAGSGSSARTRKARCIRAARAVPTWSRAWARTSGRTPTTGPSATRSSR